MVSKIHWNKYHFEIDISGFFGRFWDGLKVIDWIHVLYPVRQQVSEQGSQLNKNVLSCSRTGFSTLLLFFYPVEKRFYSVENLVQKPVGEQNKTHVFSHRRFGFETNLSVASKIWYSNIRYWSLNLNKQSLYKLNVYIL